MAAQIGSGGLVAAVDGWQRHHPAVAIPLAVLKKFLDDRASSLAALIAYYAFFSLFPLMLAFVAILGFVLQDNPALQEDIVDTALARIPVIGVQLEDDLQAPTGSGIALAIGVAGALWAGLGVMLALGRAFDDIWGVPRFEQPGALKARVRAMLMVTLLGSALIAATLGSGLALGGAIAPVLARLATGAGALVATGVVLLAAFWLLTPPPRPVRRLLPGVGVAAAGSLVLQGAGAWYVDRAIIAASDTYGTFALVIGLLSWFWLGSHLLLVSAELNVVLHHRLWPRALRGELAPADHAALRQSAGMMRQDHREQIAVSFREDGDADGRPPAP